MSTWDESQIGDLTGKWAVITGSNSGIGFETARALAEHGANVVMACRDQNKGKTAAARIKGKVEVLSLDLSDLSSVRKFATDFSAQHQTLDVLINNAGVMAVPKGSTKDGFEMQFGTNHLGHFLLTGLLLPLLKATPGSRVVTVSSNVHHFGKIRFDDLQGQRRYEKWSAYAQSKLANLLFTLELQRRLERAGSSTISVGAHPGYTATNLQMVGPKQTNSVLGKLLSTLGNSLFAQSAPQGALPTEYAAVDRNVKGGDYIGPSGFNEMRGAPIKVKPGRKARDEVVAKLLWEVSEKLTGVSYLSE